MDEPSSLKTMDGLKRPKDAEAGRRPLSHGVERVSTLNDMKVKMNEYDQPDIIHEEEEYDDTYVDLLQLFEAVKAQNLNIIEKSVKQDGVDINSFNKVSIC